ncbi:hypothetical protein AbraIFM66950_009387 [Aspergillus brasiliensis]|nr:hypothetical protein AbraIFM66950_009387 [Aspergillus brasiliensis]
MEETQARHINEEVVWKIITSREEIRAGKIHVDLCMDTMYQWYDELQQKLMNWHVQDLINTRLQRPPKDDTSSTWVNWKYLSECVKSYILHNIPNGYRYDPRLTQESTEYADVLYETCLQIAKTPIVKNLMIRYEGLMNFSQSGPHESFRDDVKSLSRRVSSCNELDPTFISPLQATCILLSLLARGNHHGKDYADIVCARITLMGYFDMTWDDYDDLWKELLHWDTP